MGSDARNVFTSSSEDTGPVSPQVCLFSHTGSLQGGYSESLCLGAVLGREERQENCQSGSLQREGNFPWAPLLGCFSGPFWWQLGKPDFTACILAKSRSGGRRSQNLRACGFLAQLPNSSPGQVLTLPGKTLVDPRWSKFLCCGGN